MTRLHTLGALALIAALAILLAIPSPGASVDSAEDMPAPTQEATVAATTAPVETFVHTAEILPSAPPMASVEPSQAMQTAEIAELRYSERELEMVAKTVWGEARGCAPDEQRLVIWTIFQQVDAGGDFAKYSTVAEIISKPNNYAGYSESYPIDPDIYALVCEEAEKWANGEQPPMLEPYAPTLPYLFFDGDGQHNWFRAEWR